MTTCNGSLYTCCSSSHSSVDAAGSLFPKPSSLIPNRKSSAAQFRPNLPLLSVSRAPARLVLVKAAAASGGKSGNLDGKREAEVVEEEEEVEEELPWIQEKALDLVEFTGTVTQALPGPRVGQSSLPWILAVPMAYLGVTFVIAVVKTVKKFNSPREKRRKLVNKNATVCISLDELFEKGTSEVNESALKELMQKTGFDIREILRKYIRYVLNEKPFNPDLIANLIHLRKETQLDDSEVAGILNEISGRIVKDKGPVVMDMSGYSEKGFKRKLAVQTLFGKIYYLSELPDFCSRDSALNIKTTFGVTDEDAEKLRLHTVSKIGDMDSLEKMIGGSKEEEEDEEEESRDDSAKAS